jgi:hypothetical protein
MDQKDLSRALRAGFWPRLKEMGFAARTDRAAWRYVDDAVDVLDVSAVGSNADACGCTPFSFSARIGSIPPFMPPPPAWCMKKDVPRPHYWDCGLQITLNKTLSQPWFTPFATAPSPQMPPAMLAHREGLMQVLRRDTHDRPDIWFVRADGSNFDEVIADLWAVTASVAIPTLARFHRPCDVIDLVMDRTIVSDPGSPAAREILHAARRVCPDSSR